MEKKSKEKKEHAVKSVILFRNLEKFSVTIRTDFP